MTDTRCLELGVSCVLLGFLLASLVFLAIHNRRMK